jgi:hypothetical protein
VAITMRLVQTFRHQSEDSLNREAVCNAREERDSPPRYTHDPCRSPRTRQHVNLGGCVSPKGRTPTIDSDKILAMIVLLLHLFGWIFSWMVSAFSSREDLLLENLALHQQLLAHAK